MHVQRAWPMTFRGCGNSWSRHLTIIGLCAWWWPWSSYIARYHFNYKSSEEKGLFRHSLTCLVPYPSSWGACVYYVWSWSSEIDPFSPVITFTYSLYTRKRVEQRSDAINLLLTLLPQTTEALHALIGCRNFKSASSLVNLNLPRLIITDLC